MRSIFHPVVLSCLVAAPLWGWAGAEPKPAARAEVESILADMRTAVMAGDVKGYMRHVATGDAIFLKETQNWANDLKNAAPEKLTFTIVEADAEKKIPAPVFTDSRAEFMLKIDWMMPKRTTTGGVGGRGGADRSVSFPVAFVRIDRPDGSTSWRYNGEVWKTLELPADPATGFQGVRVCFAPGLEEMAKTVADVAPEVRKSVDGDFENVIREPLVVKLYTSVTHLQESIYLSYSDGLGGWNEPGEAIKILGSLGRPRSAAGLKTLLGHEYGHNSTFALGEHANDAPWWVLEGIAEYSARPFRTGAQERDDAFMVRAARNKRIPDWKDLTDFKTVEGRNMGFVYTQGEHMVSYMITRFGRPAFNRWLREMGTGRNIEQATQSVFGVAFTDLDTQWRAVVADLFAADEVKKAANKADDEKKAAEEKAKKDAEKPEATPAAPTKDKPIEKP